MGRYNIKLVNGDWYVVDTTTDDLVRRCRSKYDAECNADKYNECKSSVDKFYLVFGG